MKICHYISSTGLGRGEFYIDLVNEMAKNKSVQIYLVIPTGSKYLKRISENINIFEYKSKDDRLNLFLYIELFKYFKKNKFNIVHTHFAKASEIFSRINLLLNLNHVATKHNVRKGRIFNKLKNVTAVSIDVADSIKNKNVKIIYNGITPIAIDLEKKENKYFTIRAIGRLDKIKGFDILIKEFSKIRNNAVLEIVGDGEELNNLRKQIKNLDLGKKVKLVGFKKDIPEILASSDLVIMSSLSEGFSLVMIESFFYAKVFISTPVSGCKDMLTDKLLINEFNISEKIDDVIEHYDEYLEEFLVLKKQYKEKFLLKNIVEEYMNYYSLLK